MVHYTLIHFITSIMRKGRLLSEVSQIIILQFSSNENDKHIKIWNRLNRQKLRKKWDNTRIIKVVKKNENINSTKHIISFNLWIKQ